MATCWATVLNAWSGWVCLRAWPGYLFQESNLSQSVSRCTCKGKRVWSSYSSHVPLYRCTSEQKWILQSCSLLLWDKFTRWGRGTSAQRECLQNHCLALQPRAHQKQGKRSSKWDVPKCPLAHRCCVQLGHQLLSCGGNTIPSEGDPGVIPPFILTLRGVEGPSDGSWDKETKAGSSHTHPPSKILGRNDVWTKCGVLENSLDIKNFARLFGVLKIPLTQGFYFQSPKDTCFYLWTPCTFSFSQCCLWT